MVVRRLTPLDVARMLCLLTVFAWAGGCQTGPQVSSRRLIEHQAMIDFSGLNPPTAVESVQTTLAIPRHWTDVPTKYTALYTHRQWKSPSTHTGVGVVYCRMPLPLGAKAVVWLAKQEYSKREQDGRVLSEWTDDLGRCWFEAENYKYHVRGCVVVKGFDAWITYFGYRTQYPPQVAEIALAARSAESAVPLADGITPTTRPAAQMAAGHESR